MATYWENSCSFGLRYVSWYKYLIVSLVFSHLGFWSGNLFLIAPFPDLCLLVPFYYILRPRVTPLTTPVRVSAKQYSRPSLSNGCFSFAPELVGYSAPRDLHRRAAYHGLFVCS